MRRLCVICLWVTCTVGAMARPERNAYLNKSVASVYQLVHQIKTDPVVADRYMRHFALTREQVIALMKGLHTAHLPKSETFRMYSVPDNGVLRVHICRLRAGEGVFADAAGRPVLRLRCGNPIVEGVRQSREPHAGETRQPEVVHEAATRPMAWSKGGSKRPTAFALKEPVESFSVMPKPPPSLPPKEPLPTVLDHPPTPLPPQEPVPLARPQAFATSEPGNLLPLLGLTIPLLIAGEHHHHSFLPPPPSPVPEPLSLLAMGAGICALAKKRRR